MVEAGMDTGAQRATPLIGFGLRPATPAATAPPQLQPTTNSREASTESCVFRKATAASASLIWASIVVSSTLPSLSPKPRKSMRRLANPSAAQALAARAKIPSFTDGIISSSRLPRNPCSSKTTGGFDMSPGSSRVPTTFCWSTGNDTTVCVGAAVAAAKQDVRGRQTRASPLRLMTRSLFRERCDWCPCEKPVSIAEDAANVRWVVRPASCSNKWAPPSVGYYQIRLVWVIARLDSSLKD